MKMGRWPYGHEEPASSSNLFGFDKPRICCSSGFIFQLSYVSIPFLEDGIKLFLDFLYGRRIFVYLDRKIPGYLIGGVWVK